MHFHSRTNLLNDTLDFDHQKAVVKFRTAVTGATCKTTLLKERRGFARCPCLWELSLGGWTGRAFWEFVVSATPLEDRGRSNFEGMSKLCQNCFEFVFRGLLSRIVAEVMSKGCRSCFDILSFGDSYRGLWFWENYSRCAWGRRKHAAS